MNDIRRLYVLNLIVSSNHREVIAPWDDCGYAELDYDIWLMNTADDFKNAMESKYE